MPGELAFCQALEAVEPYLPHLVVAGGWASRLLELHPLARRRDFEALRTEDADFAVDERLVVHGASLGELLKARFREELVGGEVPFSSYVLVSDEGEFSVEFITPLIGGRIARGGYSKEAAKVAGVTATFIRYVHLLLWEPAEITVSTASGFPVGDRAIHVRTANPVSYLAQKVLSLPGRLPRSKQPKDVLYIHDTLLLFADHLPDLRTQATRLLATQLPPATRRKFRTLRRTLFDANLCAGAARIAAATGRPVPPAPARIGQVCVAGLEEIFAD